MGKHLEQVVYTLKYLTGKADKDEERKIKHWSEIMWLRWYHIISLQYYPWQDSMIIQMSEVRLLG